MPFDVTLDDILAGESQLLDALAEAQQHAQECAE